MLNNTMAAWVVTKWRTINNKAGNNVGLNHAICFIIILSVCPCLFVCLVWLVVEKMNGWREGELGMVVINDLTILD